MNKLRIRNSWVLIGATLLLFLSAACNPVGYKNANALIQWRSLAEGKKEAKEKGMPVLIDFYVGMNCIRCEYLERSVYTDPEFAAAVNKNFIPVRVNLNMGRTEDEAALLWKLSPKQECVLAFLDENGQIITDENGQPISSLEKLNKEQYLSYMAKALKALKSAR